MMTTNPRPKTLVNNVLSGVAVVLIATLLAWLANESLENKMARQSISELKIELLDLRKRMEELEKHGVGSERDRSQILERMKAIDGRLARIEQFVIYGKSKLQ